MKVKKKSCPSCSGEGRYIVLVKYPNKVFREAEYRICRRCNGSGQL